VKYTDIFKIDNTVREGWNYHKWESKSEYPQYRFYRFWGDNKKACGFSEIKFKGRETIKNLDETYTCPVSLIVGGAA